MQWPLNFDINPCLSIRGRHQQPAEKLAADIAERGLILTGGGANLKGLDKRIQETVDLPVHVFPESLTCVLRGCGLVLDNMDEYQEVLIKKIND